LARCAASAHRIILSGGLKVENVAAAIRASVPMRSTSLAASKPSRARRSCPLKEFIDEVRRAEQQLEQQPETQKRILFNHEFHPSIAATAPGRFGPYGGRYVPETLMVPLFELERAYEVAKSMLRFSRS